MIEHFSAAPRVLAVEDRDYPHWHRGRERYGVWLIDADTAAIRERLRDLHHQLGDLLAPQARQPHITLFVGGFICEQGALDDDFTSSALRLQQAALQAQAPTPFDLEIGGIDSFDSAVFLKVRDPQQALSPLRATLGRHSLEPRFAPYVPHLTVGLYRAAFDKAAVRPRLQRLMAMPPLPLRVEALHFCSYAARVIGGPLQTLLTVPLQAGAGRP